MNETIIKQGELQEKIDNIDAWDLDRKAEIAMDALTINSPPSTKSRKPKNIQTKVMIQI